jgi:hypothetical protein
MKTAEEIGLEFISHHGTKGMKWGVRREQLRTLQLTRSGAKETQRRTDVGRHPSPIRVTDTIGKTSFQKTKIKAVGGEDHPAHPDALKVAASRQKLKKSGIHTLSNSDLQAMTQRMQLEQQVRSLGAKQPKALGRGFVDAQLGRLSRDPIAEIERAHRFGKVVNRTARAARIAAVVA